MTKPEWGTKQTCPKCGERFYDLGNNDPVVCIECGVDFKPEPILKTKQPIVVQAKEEAEAKEKEKSDSESKSDDDEDLDLDDDDDKDAASDNVSLDDDDDDE
ncbi:MAG: FYDLN acid domain-containing protein, partial [Kordiimonadaceae bacterium]|nr:FYDLN acid domain-containing protein [Kordiimonadaceae bacterium]